MTDKPFWEETYKDREVSTFSKVPTADVKEFCSLFEPESRIIDVGCGEGRNSIYLAGLGHAVDAFDISAAGIDKAIYKADSAGVKVNFTVSDLGDFVFRGKYDVVLSHGVLHLPEKGTRDDFLERAMKNTRAGGCHIIGIFTDRRPAADGLVEFTRSLFRVGELPEKYHGWEIISHDEGIFNDEHPGGEKHEHAYERIVAVKL